MEDFIGETIKNYGDSLVIVTDAMTDALTLMVKSGADTEKMTKALSQVTMLQALIQAKYDKYTKNNINRKKE